MVFSPKVNARSLEYNALRVHLGVGSGDIHAWRPICSSLPKWNMLRGMNYANILKLQFCNVDRRHRAVYYLTRDNNHVDRITTTVQCLLSWVSSRYLPCSSHCSFQASNFKGILYSASATGFLRVNGMTNKTCYFPRIHFSLVMFAHKVSAPCIMRVLCQGKEGYSVSALEQSWFSNTSLSGRMPAVALSLILPTPFRYVF